MKLEEAHYLQCLGHHCSDDLVEKLESEASTILNAAAVLIRALVRVVLLQYHQYYDL